MSVTSPLRRIAGRGVPIEVTSRDPRMMRQALALASPCRPALVGAFAALSGALQCAEAIHVEPPSIAFLHGDFGIGMVDERLIDLLEVLERRFGPLVDLAVTRPRQSERGGARLLLFDAEGPVAFVKIGSDAASSEREAAVLAALDRPGTARAISVPRLLGRGFDADLHWFATSPLPPGPHRPATLLPFDEVERLLAPLADLFPVPDPSWAPMHGDLTPWNLRWSGGGMWLVDWEHAGVAPRGADGVWFRAVCAVVRGRPAGSADPPSAEFWSGVVQERLERGSDVELQYRLLEVLDSMRRGGAST